VARPSQSSTKPTASERLADFALQLRFEDIPAAVVSAAKMHLLDTIGCGLAAHALGIGTAGRSVAAVAADGGSTIIGRAELGTPVDAALANGMLCHSLDFDDTHGKSICHVGTVLAPALLAIAEAHGRTGRDLITAFVVGSELTTRLGAAAAPEYMRRGFHPTSVCGVFGAAIGAARMLDLNRTETTSALGIAGSMSGGLFAYLSDGAQTKPIHAGWAASSGVRAAQLASAGGEGPRRIFEDRFGFFAAYYGGRHAAFARGLDDLGETWETPQIAYKAYPACHFIHGCLDCAAALHHESGWSADDIASVTVAVPDAVVPLVLEPLEAKRRPRTDYDAKFSLPYSVAAMLAHGQVDVSTYGTEALGSVAVYELASRVHYERRAFPTYPQAFPGWVRIENANGEVHELESLYQRGAPENPMSETEVVSKFHRNAALALEQDSAAAIENAILSLDQIDDVGICTAPLTLGAYERSRRDGAAVD
jgi:2-methylcitrate dehydratase PrpD